MPKISELDAAASAAAADQVPANQSGTTRRLTLAQIRTYVLDALTLAWGSVTGTPTTLAGYGITDAASDAELAAHEADTTSVHGITDTSTLYRSGGTDVAVADGGTGASTAADARTNLGLGTAAVEAASAFAAASHAHAGGDITSGTVAAARLPAASEAAAGIVELATSAETTAGLAVQASDSRLSDARAPTAHTHPATEISDSTAAGRALLTAADAAAQRTALALGTAAVAAAHALQPLMLSFTEDGSAYIIAHEAMTVATAIEVGTGTLAYATAPAATPTTFTGGSLPATLASGDVLRVTVSGLSGFKAATLTRSA